MTNYTIHKQQIEITDYVPILVPEGSKFLSCQIQYGVANIWYLCDPTRKTEARALRIIGTGHPVEAGQDLEFIDTIQLMEGSAVFHVFELVTVSDDIKEVKVLPEE